MSGFCAAGLALGDLASTRESRLLPVLRMLKPSDAVSALMKVMRVRMMGVSSKYRYIGGEATGGIRRQAARRAPQQQGKEQEKTQAPERRR